MSALKLRSDAQLFAWSPSRGVYKLGVSRRAACEKTHSGSRARSIALVQMQCRFHAPAWVPKHMLVGKCGCAAYVRLRWPPHSVSGSQGLVAMWPQANPR